MHRVTVRLETRQQKYEIKIGANLIADLGKETRSLFGSSSRRVALISNRTVFNLFGERATRSLRTAGFNVSHWLMKEGERHKSLRSFEQALEFLSQSRLERNDCVVALGGGVVGDLTGFAAATYLRGISFVQVPTTLLAQIDASVGGKTGINTPAGENLVGAVTQPRMVGIAPTTLRTLPARELTAGWCEAVKHGAVGGRQLLDRTVRLVRRGGPDLGRWLQARNSQVEVCATIAAHCRFKASIVA